MGKNHGEWARQGLGPWTNKHPNPQGTSNSVPADVKWGWEAAAEGSEFDKLLLIPGYTELGLGSLEWSGWDF